MGRQRAVEVRLGENELIVAKAELDSLHDDLYVLACAVDDAERDLAEAGPRAPARVLRDVLASLLNAARPIRARELS